jgi:sugar/nucleoside kinase (ribokinase family)
MNKKIIVSGVGCCLVDLLYNHIDFSSEEIKPFLSKKNGDGGLTPGRLVFEEDFEIFSQHKLDDFIKRITGDRGVDLVNIGGPSIVSLIHAAQMTGPERSEVRFFGRAGKDEQGKYLLESLARTPVVPKDFRLIEKRTPSTLVLSDPEYDDGHGERMFINCIGAAWEMQPEQLNEAFFGSSLVVFGGTAIVPRIHEHLTSLLKKAKARGSITMINTVYDFRSEKDNPGQRWPLGDSMETYPMIDVLICDREEALHLSGQDNTREALDFFIHQGTRSVIITNGAKNIHAYSDGTFFQEQGKFSLPVSEKVKLERMNIHAGDTTGCGDNFAGGLIGSVVNQLSAGYSQPDFLEALSWAVVSGGFATTYMGGTYFESRPGEKMEKIRPYYDAYQTQISDRLA